jgi:MFS family permease
MTNIFKPSFPFVPKKIPIYYGYIIVLMSIFAAIVTAPGQTVGVSVYIDYFIKSFHLSRAELSMAYMLGTIGSAMIIGRVGVWIDKWGSRSIAFFTAILLGTTLVFFSQLDKFAFEKKYHIIILLLVMIGFFSLRFLAQGVLFLISRTMLLKWFVNLRGRMSAIVGIFTTLAMSASPPLFNWLINIYGWRVSYLIMASIIGIICALIFWLLFRNTPEECGLKPDGIKRKNIAEDSEAECYQWTLSEAKATYAFWVFNLSLAMYSLLFTAFTFHVTSIFTQVGLSRHAAVTVFFPAACISLAIKLISGWLCDMEPWKSKLRYQLVIYLLALSVLCLGILLLKNNVLGRDLIIVSIGIATGLFVTLSAVCWPLFYGRKFLGGISGATTAYRIFFSAIGPYFFAVSVKLTGAYTTAVLICLVTVIILLCFALKADTPKRG